MQKQKNLIYGVIVLAGLALAWWINGNKGSPVPQQKEDSFTAQRTETRMPSQRTANPVQPRSGEVIIGQLGATVPEDWQEEPPASSMRIAQYRLFAANGTDAVLAITSGIGGSVQANINRWYGQFEDPFGKDTTFNNNDLSITFVDIRGRFLGMQAERGQDNYQMLAAIVEAPDGAYFFKLTGPQETVSSLSNSFASFVRTIRYVGHQ